MPKSYHQQVFNADPYDMIKILADFDSSLKDVSINLKNDVPVEASQGESIVSVPSPLASHHRLQK
jgi:hypothetical protein